MENTCLDPHPTQPSVRINDYQILATHNSYHKILPGNVVPELNYDPGTLSDQLSVGVRSFELDVYYHLNTSSYDVLHVPNLDDASHCNTLEECFDQVNEWKNASKSIWHVPIFYMIEFTGDQISSSMEACVTSTETKTVFLNLPEDQGTLIEGLEKIVVEKISSKSLITPVDVIKRDDKTYKWA